MTNQNAELFEQLRAAIDRLETCTWTRGAVEGAQKQTWGGVARADIHEATHMARREVHALMRQLRERVA